MKGKLLVATILAVTYVGIELLSLLFLTGVNFGKPSLLLPAIERDLAGMDDSDVRAYLIGDDYDPLLGWHHKPGSEAVSKNCLGQTWKESFDSDGARSVAAKFDTTLIASYGDSYVKGGEVNNDETWQFQLAKQIGTGVKNYAVGAYDPYQALLRIKQHIGQGNVYPVTVLGINEQNVTRIVNLYRPFMNAAVQQKLAFKPGLSCKGEVCIPIENLLRPEVQTIDEVTEILGQARRLDYWARTKPALEYPWSVNLAKLVRQASLHVISNESEPIWITPEGAAAMHFVVSDFRESVQRAGSVPAVLFIPTKPKKGTLPSYRFFKQQVQAEFPDLIVLDVADRDFDAKRFKLKPTGACHPSAYGHTVIANTVREGLQGVLAAKHDEISALAAKK